MDNIRIGTLVHADTAPQVIPQLLPHGFESFSVTFWKTTGETDIKKNAEEVKEKLAGRDVVVSSLSIFSNPLAYEEDLASWERCIDDARLYGADLVTGFTGRLPGESVPDSIPRFKEVFGDLAKRAADNGVRIAFENCVMGGDWRKGEWNLAYSPDGWELLFDAVAADNLGLQWEPCHQLVQLIDPVPQLRKWANRIFHVHGKDATVAWDIIREHGIHGPHQYCWHRHPGFGDSNWTDIVSILRDAGYRGTIDIEGWHDPVYRDELELTGQVHALNYLKRCRGGTFVPNPTGIPHYK